MNKQKCGVTLVELVAALSILMLVSAPLIGTMVHSIRANSRAHSLSMATFVAQQEMERAVATGLQNLPASTFRSENDMFNVRVTAEAFNTSDADNNTSLYRVTVYVYDNMPPTSVIVNYVNIVNTAPGGFLPLP